MLQSMLEKKLGLELHRETKEFPVYSVVVTDGGLKLTPVSQLLFQYCRPRGTSGAKPACDANCTA
jgi:uncharacterized protein (TIGR03435 family)